MPITVVTVSPPESKWYGIGDAVVFEFEFSSPVVVTGVPTVLISVGGQDRVFTYSQGSGGKILKFSRTVLDGEDSTSGVSTISPITGVIKGKFSGEDAEKTFQGQPYSGVKVDATRPRVTSVTSPGSGVKKIGDAISIDVAFSEAVYITNSHPSISVQLGASRKVQANYLSGNGTSSLVFLLTVPAGTSAQTIQVLSPNWVGSTVAPIKDRAGNLLREPEGGPVGEAFAAATFPLVIDGIRPKAPTVSLSSDTGTTGDRITSAGTLAVAGLEPGGSAEYSLDGVSWSSQAAPPEEGVNVVFVRQSDAAGNKSPSVRFQFTLDTEAPAPPEARLKEDTGSSSTDSITRVADVVVNQMSVEKGARLQYKAGSGEWSSSLNLAGVQDGGLTIQVRQVDAAGNASSPTSISFTLDRAAPARPTVSLSQDTGASQTDRNTSVGTISVGGQQSGTTLQYSSNGGATWKSSFTAVEGQNSLSVRQVDVAGNASQAASLSFTLDTVAPAALVSTLTLDTALGFADRATSATRAANGFIESGSVVQYSHNGSTWLSSLTLQTGNNRTLYVRQVDRAGNASQPVAITYSYPT
jgi:hypothetical protein